MELRERLSELVEALSRRVSGLLDFLFVQHLLRLPRRDYDQAARAYADTTASTFKWAAFRPHLRAILTAKYNDLFLDEKARVLAGAMDKASPGELKRSLDSVDYRGARAPADADLKASRYYFAGAVLDIFADVYRAPDAPARPTLERREPVVSE